MTQFLNSPFYIPLLIIFFYILAWLAHRYSKTLAVPLIALTRFSTRHRKISAERHKTIEGIFTGVVSLMGLVVATIGSLSLFVTADTLVWMIGLFSAAFGLSARPFISDILSGLAFIIDDTFDEGEKVEMLEIEGVIEKVYLRTTHLRAPTGELFIIPNGDIRLVRNFSRGLFTQVRVVLKVPTAQMTSAINLLKALGQEATLLLPNLVEPWQVFSHGDEIGQSESLLIVAKAKLGKGAEMKPKLEALVHDRLSKAGITLLEQVSK